MDKIYPEEHIQAIANAIRRKNGKSVNYLTSEMAGAIDQLENYPEPTGTIEITENGIVDVKDKAYAEVDVAGSAPVLQDLSVISNGSYSPPSGVDGFANVVVEVPTGSDTSDATLSSGAQMRLGITAYASGSKITGTMPNYSGSVNSSAGGIGGYPVYSGAYFFAPSTSVRAIPTSQTVLLSSIVLGSYNGSLPVLSDITISENGTYAPSGFDGFANVVVDVPTPSAELNELRVFADGVYNALDYGVLGFDKITVSVSAGYNYSYIAYNAFNSASDIFVASFPMVSEIDDSAFYRCENLTYASFPLCETIADCAFEYCSKLSQIYAPNCSSVGYNAFADCTNLESIDLPSCTSLGTTGYRGWHFHYCSNLSYVNLPLLEEVPSGAFQDCGNYASVMNVNIPNCKRIDPEFAFHNCGKLESIDLPSCSFIGNGAFQNCTNLSSVSLPLCTIIDGNAFANCDSLSAISLPLVTSIGWNAFMYCDILSSVYAPECVTIGMSAFEICAFEEISFPKCTTIEADAFAGITSLTSVNLPVVEVIGSRAFSGCTNLTTVSFPKCSMIYENALNCQNLSTVYLMSNSYVSIASSNAIKTTVGSIYVPLSMVSGYKTKQHWSYFSSKFVGM